MTKMIETATGAHLLKFDSMTEVVDYTDASLFKKGTRSFVGEHIPDWDAAQTKTKEHWSYGHEVLEAFVERLRSASLPQLKSRIRYTEWSFTEGDEVDIERMNAGLPYMRRKITDNTQGPGELTVIIDVTTACSVDADDILWRGAAAVALTQILEEKGYRVEVWVVNGSYLFMHDPKPVLTACCLKLCSDPLDVSTLVSTVSGWFYRSVTFTLLETICDKENEEVNYGYGTCATPMPKDLDSVSTDMLRVYASGVFSFNGALDMIIGEVTRVIAVGEGKDPAADADK